MKKFECLKCGNCCRDLVIEGIAGLMLFPNEVKLFQKRNIKPCLGIGKSPTHGSFKIFTYQLKENICPHLKDNSCTIYQERPLICRFYPFELKNPEIKNTSKPKYLFLYTNECPGIGKGKILTKDFFRDLLKQIRKIS